MTQYRSRPPTVEEAIKILSWPLNTSEYRNECLKLLASMGADVGQIKAKFTQQWKKRKA